MCPFPLLGKIRIPGQVDFLFVKLAFLYDQKMTT